MPRLKIRGPLIFGAAVVLTFFGAGIGGAALMPIDKGVGMSGTVIVESKVKPVQHLTGGAVGRILVVEGQTVAAGELLIALDTSRFDEQLAALRAQAAAAHRQLDLIRQEAATIAELHERKLASRSKLLALERQVAEVEKENAGLSAKIAMTEQELVRAEIRAPVAGRVLSVAVHGAGAVIAPGATIMEIVPEEDRLVVEGRLPINRIDSVKSGMPAKVWLSGLSWRDQRPLRARLAWVSADSVEDRRTGAPYFVARVELDDPRSKIAKRVSLHPGMRTEILLLTGERTLLDQLIDPLLRNVHRAFQS
jgi:multidrug efflux pump subunit AcrA (membrane-fusion protein)